MGTNELSDCVPKICLKMTLAGVFIALVAIKNIAKYRSNLIPAFISRAGGDLQAPRWITRLRGNDEISGLFIRLYAACCLPNHPLRR